VKLLRYIELKSGHSDNGPAWIGYVTPSKTGRTLYFNGRALMKLKGQRRGEAGGNHVDTETGIVLRFRRKEERRRPPFGSGKVLVEAAALSDYLMVTGVKTLDRSRYEVADAICQTDIKKLSQLANSSRKGWPDDPEEARNPYSSVRNVSSSQK
jgi:hypothetical protein